MKLNKIAKIIFFLILVLAISAFFFHPKTRAIYLEKWYDFTSQQITPNSKESIKAVLNSFENIPFSKLDKAYLSFSKSDDPKYRKLLANTVYRKIYQADLFKKVVGDFRVIDFVVKDQYYQKVLFNKEEYLYWLIDERLLFRILELQQALEKKGFDANAFWIRNGHRHPQKNDQVGGARSSRHLKGEAIDMVIQDINQDGKYTEEDKAIVYELVDQKIIGNRGGVGRYPGSRTIHIDVRGKRARWDSYKRN
ncbi:MAG: D-Ala-D-Ala carboxypeptidase family metallohydrolase [Bacteroidota bacterium]